MPKTIACRTEGGVGDHLLANRFIFAIKEKHPEKIIKIYSDAHNSDAPLNLLKTIWPAIYENIELVPPKSKEFWIESQFGRENYTPAFENLPEETKKKIAEADIIYDLCLDAMKWLSYDFDWFRYFYFFPKPEIVPQFPEIVLPEKFILCNLFSRIDAPFIMEKWYIGRVIKELSTLLPLIIVTTPENISFYDEYSSLSNAHILSTTLEETFYLASKCSAFVGIDSGIRVMPYYFGKPTFYFSPYFSEYGKVDRVAEYVRWGVLPRSPVPLYFDVVTLRKFVENATTNPGCKLFPEVPHDLMDKIMLKRIY